MKKGTILMLIIIVLLVFSGAALFAGGEKEAREGAVENAGKFEGAGLGSLLL